MKGFPQIAVLILLLAAGFTYLGAQSPIQQVVFENVFTAITTAQVSSPFRNIGQAMHTLQVTFPGETTTVTGIQIRLEWCSYDCDPAGGGWKPAGADITEAPVLDEGIPGVTDVIAYETYYGVFRSIRADMVTNTPGGEQLTARYTGAIVPVVPFVSLRDDRWAF